MNCTKCDRTATRRGLCHRCYENHRNRQKLYGRWQSSRVPAEPVRAHVEALRASGIGTRRIEELSGVSRSVIQSLVNGRSIYGNQPSKTISAVNAQRLLAVPEEPASGSRIDITGTTRRLQALVAIGYTQTDLAARIGITPANSTRLFHSQGRVLASTARRVESIYDRLAMTPGPSERARNHARKHGWAPPLAWDDDDLDNPDATPDAGQAVKLSWDETYLELKDLGFSDTAIANRMGIEMESLYRQLHRYGIAS